jgi:hypothetical protein
LCNEKREEKILNSTLILSPLIKTEQASETQFKKTKKQKKHFISLFFSVIIFLVSLSLHFFGFSEIFFNSYFLLRNLF